MVVSFEYDKNFFISDIAGQDIREHKDDPMRIIQIVRDWLRGQSSHDSGIPGGRAIAERYKAFRARLPELCQEARLEEDDLIWVEYTDLVWNWLALSV